VFHRSIAPPHVGGYDVAVRPRSARGGASHIRLLWMVTVSDGGPQLEWRTACRTAECGRRLRAPTGWGVARCHRIHRPAWTPALAIDCRGPTPQNPAPL